MNFEYFCPNIQAHELAELDQRLVENCNVVCLGTTTIKTFGNHGSIPYDHTSVNDHIILFMDQLQESQEFYITESVSYQFARWKLTLSSREFMSGMKTHSVLYELVKA